MAVVTVMACGLACSDSAVESATWTDPLSESDLPERVVHVPDWERTYRVGGTLDDTLFWNPFHIAPASDGGVVVLDAVARRAVSLDADGSVSWTFGGRGAGPEEFELPSDIAVGPDGDLHILDRQLLRMTVVDQGGRLSRVVTLDEGPGLTDRIAAVTRDGYTLIAPTSETPIWRYDLGGALEATDSFPWPPFLRIPAIPRVFAVAPTGPDGWWAAAFTYGTGLFVLDGARAVTGRRPYPELVSFPRMERRELEDGRVLRRVADPEYAALSVTSSPRRLYVLFAGKTEHRRRLVDSYDRETGAYVESWVLPEQARRIAWSGGAIHLVRADPYPSVEGWRLPSGGLP